MVLPLLGLWAVRRAWITLGVASGIQIALTLAASAWLGVSPVRLFGEWLANARSQEVAGTIDLPTIAARLLPDTAGSGSAISLVALALIVWTLRVLRRLDDRTLGALGLYFGAVFAYHRHYDLVLLLPPLTWLANEARARRDGWSSVMMAMLAAALGALLILPTHPAPLRRFAGWYDAGFLGMAYVTLGVLLVAMAGRNTGTTCRLASRPASVSQARS